MDLTFTLPDCLLSPRDQQQFKDSVGQAMSGDTMPHLYLRIRPKTTDKDISTAIQLISGINKYLPVTFHMVEEETDEAHVSLGYLKLCQSWLPNVTIDE